MEGARGSAEPLGAEPMHGCCNISDYRSLPGTAPFRHHNELSPVGVEKVTSISGMRFGRSMVEESDLPMLCWILITGGLLIMMGQHDRSEALFYYFRLRRSGSRDAPAAAHR
jgi:hypothetical protein